MTSFALHQPVMLHEILKALDPQKGKIYVDSTFGAGGYTRAILDSADCKVYGIDRDPDAIQRGQQLAAHNKNFTILEGNFSDLEQLLKDANISAIDGIVFDLGVSSPQLDESERGFSFQKDGPLDMRMEKKGETAADVVNTLGEKELARIIWEYGDEPKSRSIAKAIVERRKEVPFTRTLDLAALVHKIVKKKPHQKIDPATKTFQALRIYVNAELKSLEQGLEAAEKMLAPGGRLVVVSFHALEDERVKKFLRHQSGNTPNPSRHQPMIAEQNPLPSFQILERKAQQPSDEEVTLNPRARSARLRWAIRTSHAVSKGYF